MKSGNWDEDECVYDVRICKNKSEDEDECEGGCVYGLGKRGEATE